MGKKQGKCAGPFSSEGACQRRGPGGGGARGGRELPVGGLGRGWSGWRRALHSEQRPAAELSRDGGAPAMGGGGDWVREHPWEVEVVMGCSIWEEGARS